MSKSVNTIPLPPVEAGPGVLVHPGRDRELSAATWLVLAASWPETARQEWATYGVALLRCGALFSAVRIPAALVQAVAGSEDRQVVEDFLRRALDGGVFYDAGGRQFYALTPASTARLWRLTAAAECLGSDSFLGVPATDRNEPDPRYPAHWVVPMEGPASLCTPGDVARLVLAGHQAAAKVEEESR